jgi:ADP-ribose pyrophosphatase YjhB (NUDIX family)
MIPASHPELCVGAVVTADGRLLLVQRGRGAGIGLWSIPGGRVELGEPMAAAVVRELREETGLAGRVVRHLGWVERLVEGAHFVIHDYLVDVDDPGEAVAADDAAAVRWVPVGDVAATPGLAPGLLAFLREHAIVP